MTGEIRYERHDETDATTYLDTILAAYEEVYADPPYDEDADDVAEFIDRYHAQAKRSGMRLIIAYDGDQVAGFAYGFLLRPDAVWWDNIQDGPLPAEFTREDGQRTFAVIELAVRKLWRRRGIAKTLHAGLLDGLTAERATLTVRPEAEADPARSAYTAWGYRKVGISRPWEEAPRYECMVLDLHRSVG